MIDPLPPIDHSEVGVLMIALVLFDTVVCMCVCVCVVCVCVCCLCGVCGGCVWCVCVVVLD